MKTICAYSYDLDCLVSTLIFKWVKQIPNYDFVAEPMAHDQIRSHCSRFVNKKEGNFLFVGFTKDELVGQGCDKDKFKSIQKVDHKPLSKLLYDKFKTKFNFTIPQKQLIAMAIDKHTYTYKNKNSYHLDILFHDLSRDRFIYLFGDGMTTIDDLSNTVLKESLYKFSEKSERNLREFIFENSRAFVGTVYDMSHYEYKYMKEYDTIVVIDTIGKRVYFRNKNPNNKVLQYCKEFCDGGGTNDYCSGHLTNKFMESIKNE